MDDGRMGSNPGNETEPIPGRLGNMSPIFEKLADRQCRAYSWLDAQWSDLEVWKQAAGMRLKEHLRFSPDSDPLAPEVLRRRDMGDYFREEVRFGSCLGMRVTATLLLPKGEGPFPAIIGLHDHGGFYYYGKEKLIENEHELEALKEFKQLCYEGRSWGTDAVRRGYAVIVIDAFWFGTRAVDPASLPEDMTVEWRAAMAELENREAGTAACAESASGEMADSVTQQDQTKRIQAFNRLCGSLEPLVSKHFHTAGATWAGLIGYDDRRTVDFLLTRPEIDPERIGCCGLSLGGYRSAFLAGTDPRIHCAVVTCWLPTFPSLIHSHLVCHTFMAYVPGLTNDMDLPDVASLTMPNPLLVQYGAHDPLYPPAGMRAAADQLEAAYAKAGVPERVSCRFYDNGHVFTVKMQQEAFAWFDLHFCVLDE